MKTCIKFMSTFNNPSEPGLEEQGRVWRFQVLIEITRQTLQPPETFLLISLIILLHLSFWDLLHTTNNNNPNSNTTKTTITTLFPRVFMYLFMWCFSLCSLLSIVVLFFNWHFTQFFSQLAQGEKKRPSVVRNAFDWQWYGGHVSSRALFVLPVNQN